MLTPERKVGRNGHRHLKKKKVSPWASGRFHHHLPSLSAPHGGSEDLRGGHFPTQKVLSSLPSISESEIPPVEIIPFQSSFIRQRLLVRVNDLSSITLVWTVLSGKFPPAWGLWCAPNQWVSVGASAWKLRKNLVHTHSLTPYKTTPFPMNYMFQATKTMFWLFIYYSGKQYIIHH